MESRVKRRKRSVRPGCRSVLTGAWNHFKTITRHKYLVMKGCFAVGLYRQGLTHDLSKYAPSEFLVGARYFQGDRSPNNAEREEKGYSSAWLHHKGRNKHHYEYWIDYSTREVPGGIAPVEMPVKYVAEMLMDRIAASRVYLGKEYTDGAPLRYFQSAREIPVMHEKTKKLLTRLLQMLDEKGEEATFAWVRNVLLRKGGRSKGRFAGHRKRRGRKMIQIRERRIG